MKLQMKFEAYLCPPLFSLYFSTNNMDVDSPVAHYGFYSTETLEWSVAVVLLVLFFVYNDVYWWNIHLPERVK